MPRPHSPALPRPPGPGFSFASARLTAGPGALAVACVLACLLAFPGPARAFEGLYLTWNDCAQGDLATSNKSFACDTDLGVSELYCAFTPPQAVDNVVAVEIVVDLQHSSPALPDWWRLEPGGCRSPLGEKTLDAAASFPGRSACVDMWAGANPSAIAELAGYVPGQPGGAANQARIKVTASVLPGQPRTLSTTGMYYAARLILRNTRTVGNGSCPGCSEPACLVLNSVRIGRLPGSPGGDLLLQAPGPAFANWARWQGGEGADCAAVPARARAWGQIKGQYR